MLTSQKVIPYGKQDITPEDIAVVVEALQSDFLTQGPKIKEFEDAFAGYTGSKYAVAVANGTAALHIAALALNVGEGSNVICTPITFAASSNCIRYCGGEVHFADIDPLTYLLDIDKAEALINSKPAGFFKGIVAVDFAGAAVNFEKLRKLADKHGLWLIEDACHSPGGHFTDSKGIQQACGSCNYADMAVFSFHPVKHIACGEGGMITTNSKELYNQLLMLRSHGITRNAGTFINELDWAAGNATKSTDTYPGWYMEMQELGFNYRITDFQAALGSSQLKKADQGLIRRREIAARYADAFNGESWLFGQSGAIEGHAYHLYVVEVEDRLGLYNYLRGANIFPQVHYIPVHLMPYYRERGSKEGDLPLAELYYSRCLSLPMYPTLRDEEQEFVINKVKEYYG